MKNKALAVVLLAMVFVMLQVLTASAQMVSITEIMMGNLSSLSNSPSVYLTGDNSSASTSFDTKDSDLYYNSGPGWWTGGLPVHTSLSFSSVSNSVTLTRHVDHLGLDSMISLEKALPLNFSSMDSFAIYLDSYDSNPANTISISNIHLNGSLFIDDVLSVSAGDSRLYFCDPSAPITSLTFDVTFGAGSSFDLDTARFELYAFDSAHIPTIQSVPEPSTVALSLIGISSILFFRKKA